MEKYIPKVGEHLYLRQRTGDYYNDLVKNPYTVIEVKGNKVVIQACKLTPPVYHYNGNPALGREDLDGQRVWFYNTVAEIIEEDSNGEVVTLHYAPKKQQWQIDRYHTGYPEFAVFGEWKHCPYLN